MNNDENDSPSNAASATARIFGITTACSDMKRCAAKTAKLKRPLGLRTQRGSRTQRMNTHEAFLPAMPSFVELSWKSGVFRHLLKLPDQRQHQEATKPD
jgi:hypothetical protein